MLLTFLQRLGGVLVAIALTIAALLFASVILAVAAAVAIVLGGWLWWRTRDVRRELRRRDLEGTADVERAEGAVIEGEYRRIDERSAPGFSSVAAALSGARRSSMNCAPLTTESKTNPMSSVIRPGFIRQRAATNSHSLDQSFTISSNSGSYTNMKGTM
jgi:hypothetical protein